MFLGFFFPTHFSNFYRPSLHFPLWGQCCFYTSCFEQALEHPPRKEVWGGWCYVQAPARGSGELPRGTSSLHAQPPRAFQPLEILSTPWGKKLGRTRGKGDGPCARKPHDGQPGARRNPGAGGKRGIIPILIFPSNLLVFKCRVPNPPPPPRTLAPALAASLRNVFVVRGS